ncbi:MAG: aspartate carbamoyltransferase [Phototrophicaceae bacterium]
MVQNTQRDQRRAADFVKRYNPPRIYGDFKGKHVVTVEQFERADLDILFKVATSIRRRVASRDPEVSQLARGYLMASLFFEASTRTDLSFQAAMRRLGGEVITPSGGVQFSSVYKGENLADTVRAAACYADVIALRHPERGASYEAAYYLDTLRGRITRQTMILSGGDGIGEHPTQALLDLFTILDQKQSLDNLTITLVGDLKHGRTVHSLAKLIARFENAHTRVNLVSPESLKMPREIVAYLNVRRVATVETDRLTDVLGKTDVIYWTRVQEERFENPTEYDAIADAFIMTPDLLAQAQDDAILMHPLPRKHEMGTPSDHDLLDEDTRSVYFAQMENGMFVRMALLALVLGLEV